MLFVNHSFSLQVQDLADQGDLFVGFLPQPGGGPYFLGHLETDELSSLHSSPCSVDRRPLAISPASERQQEDDANEDSRNQNLAKFDLDFPDQDLINQNLQMQDSESSQCWNNQNPFTENPQYLYEREHTRDEDLKNQVESTISFRAPETHPARGTKTESVLPNCDLAENQQPDHREQGRSQEKHSMCTGTTQMLNRECTVCKKLINKGWRYKIHFFIILCPAISEISASNVVRPPGLK